MDKLLVLIFRCYFNCDVVGPLSMGHGELPTSARGWKSPRGDLIATYRILSWACRVRAGWGLGPDPRERKALCILDSLSLKYTSSNFICYASFFFPFFLFVLRRIATSIMCHGSKLQPTISFPFDSRSFLDTGHKHVLLPFFLNSVNVQPIARKLLHSSTMLLSVENRVFQPY